MQSSSDAAARALKVQRSSGLIVPPPLGGSYRGVRRLGDVPAEGPQVEALDPLDRQHHGDLAAVVAVVGEDPPDGPLPRDGVVGAAEAVAVGAGQVVGGPLVQYKPDRR